MSNPGEVSRKVDELLQKPVENPRGKKHRDLLMALDDEPMREVLSEVGMDDVVGELIQYLDMPHATDSEAEDKAVELQAFRKKITAALRKIEIRISGLNARKQPVPDELLERQGALNDILTFLQSELVEQNFKLDDILQALMKPKGIAESSPVSQINREKVLKDVEAARAQFEKETLDIENKLQLLSSQIASSITTHPNRPQLDQMKTDLQNLQTAWSSFDAKKTDTRTAQVAISPLETDLQVITDQALRNLVSSIKRALEASLDSTERISKQFSQAEDILWVKRVLLDIPEVKTVFDEMAPAKIPNIPTLTPTNRIVESFKYLELYSTKLDAANAIIDTQSPARRDAAKAELVSTVPSRSGNVPMTMDAWRDEWADQAVATWETNFESVYPQFRNTPPTPGSFREHYESVEATRVAGYVGKTPDWFIEAKDKLPVLYRQAVESISNSATLGIPSPRYLGQRILESNTLKAWDERVRLLVRNLEEKQTGVGYKGRINGFTSECAFIIGENANPILLAADQDHIGNKYAELSSRLGGLRTEIENDQTMSSIEKNNAKDELRRAEIEMHKTIFKLTLKAVNATLESYEMNNKPIGSFFDNQDTFLKNHAYKHADETIARIQAIAGVGNLPDKMKTKLDNFKKLITARLMSYTTYDTLGTTVIYGKPDEKGVARMYPGSAKGIYSDNNVLHDMWLYTYPVSDSEVDFPGEKEPNPLVGAFRSEFRIKHALEDTETTFLGASVVRRDAGDGEWVTLESNQTLRSLMSMAAVEMLSTSGRFSTNFSNFHTPDRWDKVGLEDTFLKEVWPAFIDEVVLPQMVERTYVEQQVQATPGFASLNPQQRTALEQSIKMRPALAQEKKRVKDLLETATPAQAKQAIMTILQPGLPSVLAGSTPLGLSDGVYYTHHLDYILSDERRQTKRAVPFRALMMAAPSDTVIYETLDTIVESLKREYEAGHMKLIAGFYKLMDLPAGGIAAQIKAVVTKHERLLESQLIEQGDPQADRKARGRFEHLKTGNFCPLNNESRIDFNAPLVEEYEEGGKKGIRSKFSKRKLNPYYPGFHSPWDSMFIGKKNSSGELKPRRYADQLDAAGNITALGEPLKMMDLVDANGLMHFELFDPEFIGGSLPKYYSLYAAKVNAIYGVLAANPGDYSKMTDSLSDATNKDALYGAEAFPGFRGRQIRIGRRNAVVEKDKFVETMILADALTMAIEGKQMKDIITMINSTGSLLAPEAKAVIREIVNSSFLAMSMLSGYLTAVSEQISKAFVYQK